MNTNGVIGAMIIDSDGLLLCGLYGFVASSWQIFIRKMISTSKNRAGKNTNKKYFPNLDLKLSLFGFRFETQSFFLFKNWENKCFSQNESL